MRNMSFSLTKKQILDQSKTVTRRLGWMFLKEGDLVQPVEKGMGLKKGEKVKKLGCPIRIVSAMRVRLINIDYEDLAKEGFPTLTALSFGTMFCEHNKCKLYVTVTRIEFEYTEDVRHDSA